MVHQMDFMQKLIGKDITHLSWMKKATASDLRNLALPKESTFILRVNQKRKKNHTRNLISRLSRCNLKTFLRMLQL
uniref:SH3GL interacting endocytic adaptor 1 n=1 Tax=Rousettus aegyptiacus TaxID=9407 RepID=A0A7J8KGH5_ROUAE|nr:SH3GL interacting endocytic adaptor 1 [Rousettus aegyptiacus]